MKHSPRMNLTNDSALFYSAVLFSAHRPHRSDPVLKAMFHLCKAGRVDAAMYLIQSSALEEQRAQCPKHRQIVSSLLEVVAEKTGDASMLLEITSRWIDQPQGLVDLYHGTSSWLLPSILEKGLVPKGGAGSDYWACKHRRYSIVDASVNKRPPSVYLVQQSITGYIYAEHAAEMHPGSSPVILHLKVPQRVAEQIKSDELDEEARRYEGVIRPEWITRISGLYGT